MDDRTSEPAPTYLQLRERTLNLDPHKLGLNPSSGNRVWGVIMETGYEVGTASLVVIEDGTTSLYYSTGGGLVGSPDYYPVAEAAKKMVAQAGALIIMLLAAEEIDLPSRGEVRFTLLTFSGKLTAVAPEQSLASGEHALSQLYQAGRETLKQLSLLKDKKRA